VRRPSRTLTTLAAGVLLLDAVLLVFGGVVLGRAVLVAVGAVFGLLAGLVVLAWRRYRRTMAEVEAARREIRGDVEAIRELLHRHHLDN
jgi:hypothetical protein